MVKTLTIDGKDRLAIILGEHDNIEELTWMREGIWELLEAVFSSDETKDSTSSLSIYMTLNLYKLMEV